MYFTVIIQMDAPTFPSAAQCHLFRGVHPLLYTDPSTQENWVEDVEERLLAGLDKGRKEGYITTGSTIILLSGWRPGQGNINTIRIFRVTSDNYVSYVL